MSWLPKESVIVPYDFSDESAKAVELARSDFVGDAKNLHIVHVLLVLSPMEPGVIWDEIDNESRQKNVIEAIKDRFSGSEYEGVNIHVPIGDPGQEVADLVSKLSAEVIVLPSHGRSGIKRILMGSVAERIIRLASCPVVVLRGE